TVIIDEAGENQGANTWDGSTLEKSAYDPVNKAANYTNQEVKKLQPFILKAIPTQHGLVYSVTFKDGTCTWLSLDQSGGLPDFVKKIVAEAVSDRVRTNLGFIDIDPASGIGFALPFKDFTPTDLTLGLDGQFKDFVIERIRSRLGLKVISSYSRIDVVNCLGDSLTEGGSPSPHYPQFLQTLMPNGTSVNNYGVGGQESMDIAIRCGAVILAVNAGTILANASAVTFGQASKKRAADGVAINGNCRGIATGYLAGVHGTMSMSDATFTPDSTLNADVTVAQGTVFYPDHAKSLDKEGVLIWWSGQNDLAFGWPYVTTAPRDCAKAMVDILQSDKKRVVIISATTCSNTFIANVKNQNEELKAYVATLVSAGHDAVFLDAQNMLTDPVVLISLGYDPTTSSNAASIAAGLIPSELTIDGVHFNSNVKTNFTAKQIKRIFARKGWL
ncbi:SGNH/GDSL hydrolase family protein, partial [uncultured Acinetobacter sp.]|uniref:SGNH/GDSL hydrolase family protein n=1 Tax=uncultured Acinetobacter sp. TaxID=165433 RepID=UPI0025834D06